MAVLSGEPLLFQNVTVRYGNSHSAAVDNLTLEVGVGERVALIGPSGAGKSTILRLAAGLTLPSSGVAKIFGVDSTQLGRRANRDLRSRIGIISQDFALVGPLRVASNVAAGRLGAASWIRAVLSVVKPGPIEEIGRVLDSVGIADKIWDRADQLSGGQQQRTAIARTLFQRPDLLLADEPVSALDPARSDSVMAVLANGESPTGQNQAESETRRAMIASMHDAPLALTHCDRIIGLRDGRVEFDKPSGEVTDDMLTALYLIEETVTG